jgi:Flavin containing amine oxidoreductase
VGNGSTSASPPTTTGKRLQADGTGYDNLFVTGDWTANGIYLACVEGAVQAGIRTARAISKRWGIVPEKYVIIAEELLNLQVLSPAPKRSSRDDTPAVPAAPAQKPRRAVVSDSAARLINAFLSRRAAQRAQVLR